MIREVFRNEIGNALGSNTFFSYYDFEIAEEVSNIVKILYLPDDEYYFKFTIPTSRMESENRHNTKEYYYKATIAPWTSAICENANFEGKEELLNGIMNWMNYLKEDLLNTPINRKIQEHEKRLNEFGEVINNMGDEYLSPGEIQELIRRIDELELSMEENINALNKKSEEKEMLIKSLKEEIEAIKEKMEIFNKKNFFRTFAAKIMQWASNPINQKLLGNGVTMVKNLIEKKTD